MSNVISELMACFKEVLDNADQSNMRVISAEGKAYFLHIKTNDVYSLLNKHVGHNFDPVRMRFEFLEDLGDYDEASEEELTLQLAFQIIMPVLIAKEGNKGRVGRKSGKK